MPLILLVAVVSCNRSEYRDLAREVRSETLRSWKAQSHADSTYSIMLGAYSTLRMMNFDAEADAIETFIAESASFDHDGFVSTGETITKVLGGLLSIYDSTENPAILEKARDLGDRLLPAFATASGLPAKEINLATGEIRGSTESGTRNSSSLIEFGMLSRFTGNPAYYQAAFDATTADPRMDPESLYKAWLLFGDDELKRKWDVQMSDRLIQDAAYAGLLALSGKVDAGERLFDKKDIKSMWYLHVYTGDESYRKLGVEFWKSVPIEPTDVFFAETMKYLYLLFTDKPAYTPMDVVFSAGAHPFKR